MKTTHIKTHIFLLITLFVLVFQSNTVQAQEYDLEYYMRDANVNSYIEMERNNYGWRDINLNDGSIVNGQLVNMNSTFNTNTSAFSTGSNSNFVSNTNRGVQSGNFATVNSVYLNQVPYTGPEDVAKGIAFIIAILAWSIAGALIIKNKMDKKAISNRVAMFKKTNRTLQF